MEAKRKLFPLWLIILDIAAVVLRYAVTMIVKVMFGWIPFAGDKIVSVASGIFSGALFGILFKLVIAINIIWIILVILNRFSIKKQKAEMQQQVQNAAAAAVAQATQAQQNTGNETVASNNKMNLFQ